MYVDKNKVIGKLFYILCQFEKIQDKASGITIQSWCNYLDRLYVWFLGYGKPEICVAIKGLQTAADTLQIETVRRVVFDMITTIDKGG